MENSRDAVIGHVLGELYRRPRYNHSYAASFILAKL